MKPNKAMRKAIAAGQKLARDNRREVYVACNGTGNEPETSFPTKARNTAMHRR